MTAPSFAMQVAILRAAGWPEPAVVRLTALRAMLAAHPERASEETIESLRLGFARYLVQSHLVSDR